MTVKAGHSSRMTCDYYEGLGWELINKIGIINVKLIFRRDRKIENRAELLKAQKEIDEALTHINVLEKKKTKTARVTSLILGIVSSLILGTGMSAVLVYGEDLAIMVAGSAVGLLGIVGCALAFPIFSHLKRKKIAKITPIIETKFDEIGNILEKAHTLAA